MTGIGRKLTRPTYPQPLPAAAQSPARGRNEGQGFRGVHQGTKTAARGMAARVLCFSSCARLCAREPVPPERLPGSFGARAPPE